MATIKLTISGDPGTVLEWIGNLKKAGSILEREAQIVHDSCTHRGKFTNSQDEDEYKEKERLAKWLRMLVRGMGRNAKSVRVARPNKALKGRKKIAQGNALGNS